MKTRFGFHPRITVVGLTGGPSSGKTTLLAVAQQYFEDRGKKVITLSETATEFVVSGFPLMPQFWRDPLKLQKHILDRVLFLENLYHEMCENLDTDKDIILIVDRPALDGLAYIDRILFQQMLDREQIVMHALRERYKAIIHLETAAASEGYTLENNKARSESAELALALDRKTKDAWLGHQHHKVIKAVPDFDKKKTAFLKAFARILNMPEPYEIEFKYRIDNFDLSMIPANAARVRIVQTYLKAEGGEHRVRMRTIDGDSSYYETRKFPTYSDAKRVEKERQISRSEYESLLAKADPDRCPIRKMRHIWEEGGHTFELDLYDDIPGLAVLEVEVPSEDTKVLTPDGWHCTDITRDKDYKNSAIARFLKIGDTQRLLRVA